MNLQSRRRAAGAKSERSQRLKPDERQHAILEGAIRYFAEFGFDGRTRELANHLGISQALIFRYFPSKSSLIDRVYEVVFLNRWNDSWSELIEDRAQPLDERLKAFYKDYHRSIDRYEVIRISLFSALLGESLSRRYLDRIRKRIIWPIVGELRHHLGLAPAIGNEPHPLEEEFVFGLHGAIVYSIIRRHVFDLRVPDDPELMIEIEVDSFLAGAPEALARIATAGANTAEATAAPG